MWRVLKKKEIEVLLLAVLPYLVIKREQAKLLLAFVRLPREANNELRQVYWQQLRILNSRGISVTTNTQDAVEIKHFSEYPNLIDTVKIESELNGDIESAPSVN